MKQYLSLRLPFSDCSISMSVLSAVLSVTFILAAHPGHAQMYMDHASLWGIDEIQVNSSDHWGSGLSFFDINGDGWDDLTYTNDGDSIRIFLNTGGQFEEVSHNIPVLGAVKEVAWFDMDNDGVMELLVSSRMGKYQLFKMVGDFEFEDISVQAGLFQNQTEHYGVAIGDYNIDGFLDFYVSVYSNETMENNSWNQNQLYRNNGDGTFTNVTAEAGVGDGIGATFDAAWMDYNVDGWPDLYVINDRMPHPNKMYRNNGDGTFTDVAESIGADFANEFPMTATIGDYNNDGALDIYLTNVGGQRYSELLKNNGDGTFMNAGNSAGVRHNYYSWGSLWIDFDNNGLRDLYVATSPIALLQPVYRDIFYKNEDGEYFSPVINLLNDVQSQRNYGVAMGDVDNNGYPDIATQTVAPYSPNVWVSSGGNHNYIKISLTGTASNYMAIGSWITVFTDGLQSVHYTNCGQNYVSQDSQHILFGIEQSATVDSIHVEYLSGHIDTYYELPANEHYYFTEGETAENSISALGDLSFCEGENVTLDGGDYPQLLWSTGDTTQFITVSDSGEYSVLVHNEFGVAIYSDTLEVTVYPNPVIEYFATDLNCNNDSTGAISLENMAANSVSAVNWESGHEGAYIDNLQAGEYHYTVFDLNGCTATGMVFLQEPLPLSVLAFVFPESQGNDGSISLIVNGGSPPYQVFLDSVEYDLDGMNNLTAGLYLISVIDANGCTEEQEVTIESVTSVEQVNKSSVGLYPNPTQDILYFKGVRTINEVKVYDSAGRLITTRIDQNIQRIDVSELPSGQYTIFILDASGNSFTDFFTKL